MIHWGLLSTANINRRVIPAIQQSPRGELTAVASRSSDAAAAYAENWDIPQAFGSYQSMLDSDAVDAVYIALPNHLHCEWTVRALAAGKHVLCEKPFAVTLAEVDKMMAAAAASGKVLAEAFMYRHHPQMKLAGEIVHNGRIGEVTLIRGTFNFSIAHEDNIRLQPDMGGGSLWDVGVYPLSFAQYIMGGLPVTVQAAQRLGESGVDEFFAGQLIYENGVVAQISSSFKTPFHTMVEVLGTKGRLFLTRPFVSVEEGKMILHEADQAPEYLPVSEEYLYLGEIEDMHDAILKGQANYLTLAESRQHVQTVLALYEAARSKQPVFL